MKLKKLETMPLNGDPFLLFGPIGVDYKGCDRFEKLITPTVVYMEEDKEEKLVILVDIKSGYIQVEEDNFDDALEILKNAGAIGWLPIPSEYTFEEEPHKKVEFSNTQSLFDLIEAQKNEGNYFDQMPNLDKLPKPKCPKCQREINSPELYSCPDSQCPVQSRGTL